MAEAKVLDERLVAHKPRRLSFVEAAAAPLVTITAWEALRERARVTHGQLVLVQGGAGGVGHMSVQIARTAGARVAATVSAGPKVESPWPPPAIEAMQQRNLRVSFTWMPAPSVFGWFGERERQTGILEDAARLFDSGALSVHVGATFPLSEAAAAHRALEAGQALGKAVLII